jgi:pyruvate,water dikinase
VRFGGKAVTLADLAHDGLPVPPGWVIEAKTFQQFVDDVLPKGHDIPSLLKLAGTREGTDRAARARDRILKSSLPSEMTHALGALWGAIEADAPWGLSVRSSATCEDARGSSLAGLATSILGARGTDALADAVRQVWSSLYLPRTLLYLQRWGTKSVAMAVLIMPVVRAKAAGVLFTAPPTGLEGPRWRADERLVHATWGLGAPIVDGANVVDTYRLDVRGELVESVVAEKTTELVVEDGALVARPVGADRARLPALSTKALAGLASVARQLVARERDALDIEFAIDGSGTEDRVIVLQARPITGGLFPEGGGEDTVWSRANVGEALPGAATPLTWSVARGFSDQGFRAAFEALGCRVPKGAVLVANVYGRFYLNLTAFMDIAGQVPGLSPRALLEQSGGAPESIVERLEARASAVSKRGFFLRAPLSLPGRLARQLRLEREVAAWESEAEVRRRRLVDMDLALLPDDALAQTLTAGADLLVSAGELMLTCASSSLAAHLALTTTLGRLMRLRDARGEGASPADVRHEASRSAQALMGGIAEVESANPGLALLRVARIARREPEASDIILAGAETVNDLPAGPTRAGLLEFLEGFGDRAVREAELMTPRWREDHASLLAMLAAALRGPEIDPDAGPARARALADRELARLEGMLTGVEVTAIRALVGLSQTYTRLRERMRAWVTRTLGLLRLIALDIDRRLRRIDPTLAPGSVFFCTFDELVAALRVGRADIAHIIRLRRAEFQRDAARPDPPATFVGRPPPMTLPPSAAPRLVGLAASPGVVEGPARVVVAGSTGGNHLRGADVASLLQPGEILVARATDIGMSPLFLLAAGVVTELGGPLSHAAIVAREYSVPAVVNVEGATLSIRTGDRLRVDGDRGIVEKLGSAAAPTTPPER